MQNPPSGYTRVCPYLLYEDAASAVEYLTKTFGFVQRLSQTGAAGRTHTELLLGEGGRVMQTAPVGDRRFTATDPEGQVWVFAQRVASGSPRARETSTTS
jgi:uncharacterized glyoxalase superfamily protein PhnB